MNKYAKIGLVILAFCGIFLVALADRGGFVKKTKTRLNIATQGSLQNSIAFNLRSGISYKGSFLLNKRQVGNNFVSDAIISYKKGNTIYILPYKQKIFIPEYDQKSGYKLIIRSRK
ncbi:MAG: hypothetical protein M3139_05850 [Bacteroidota bacterium]|nr:hypothetical protein [Bacteroidota bacterium]